MNINEAVVKILNDYTGISEFTDGVQIDFTNSSDENVGLSSINDVLVKTDVVGNEERKHTFNLYVIKQGMNDYDRLQNSNFMLNLGYYLDNIKNININAEINGRTKAGYIKKLSCSNAMLYSVLSGDLNENVMYQIQISATYKIGG